VQELMQLLTLSLGKKYLKNVFILCIATKAAEHSLEKLIHQHEL